ncbi:MAG: hypothetical protein ACI36V_01690 [Coriobacteriales bacterium]
MEFLKYEAKPIGDGHMEIKAIVSGADIAKLIEDGYRTLADAHGIRTVGPSAELRRQLLQDPQRTPEDLDAIIKGYTLSCCVPYAIDRLDVETITQPVFYCEKEPEAGVDLDVTIIALIKPQLSLSSYEPVEVDLPQAVFTDEDIDGRIAEFADQHATYDDIADVRPIQLEDYAHVKLVISREGKVIPQLTGAHNLFQCSYSTMPKEFIDQMLGMLPGETREFDFMGPVENSVTPDELALYHGVVTLESLVEKRPADICDQWFKDNYPVFDSLDAFKADMKAKLEKEALQTREQHKEIAVDYAILDRLQGSIPDEIYEFVMENMTSNFLHNLQRMGKTKEEFFKENNTDEQQYTTSMMLEARRALRQGFALDALFRGREMELTDDDVHAYLSTIAPGQEDRLLGEMQDNGRSYVVMEEARRHKAHRWLLETATFNYVSV